MEEPRELRVLTRSESLELLASARLGRVILSAHALPTAMPVNYALDGDGIVFRSGAGMKLSAAEAGTVVAFQVDHFDTDLRMGWSVVVTGVAKRLVDPHEVARAEALAVPTWIQADDHQLDFVRIEIGSVTGRWLVPVAQEPGAVRLPRGRDARDAGDADAGRSEPADSEGDHRDSGAAPDGPPVAATTSSAATSAATSPREGRVP